MKTTFLIISLSLINSCVFGQQKWVKEQIQNGDTIVQIWTLVDLSGAKDYTEIGDSGLYSVCKYIGEIKDENFIFIATFNRNHEPIEGSTDYHKMIRFEEGFFSDYFKYYDKNGKQLRRVEIDVVWDDFSDVSLKVFEYDKRGNLRSLSFFKTQDVDYETFEELDEPILIPTGKAYFEADVHKYVWKIKKRKGVVVQKIYDTFGELVEEKEFELK